MAWEGYGLRIGQISYCASDSKSWYGLHFVGFGGTDGSDAGLPQQEFQPPYGFAARPDDASSDGVGCNGFFSVSGDFAWLGHDPRYTSKCPALESGDVTLWNKNGTHIKLKASGDEIQIVNSGGATITVTGTDVTITGANVTVGGAGAKLVALAPLTDQELQTIYQWLSTHTHGTGVGPSSPPITPPQPPNSVACAKTKTE